MSLLFYILVGFFLNSVGWAVTPLPFEMRRDAHVRLSLQRFVAASEDTPELLPNVESLALEGVRDLAILYRTAAAHLIDASLSGPRRLRVERILRLPVREQIPEKELAAADRSALINDALFLLRHYRDDEPMFERISFYMTEWDLWDHQAFDFFREELAEGLEDRILLLLIETFQRVEGESLHTLKRFVHQSKTSEKLKLSLFASANVLSADEVAMILRIGAREFGATVNAFDATKDDEWTSEENQYFGHALGWLRSNYHRDVALRRIARAVERESDDPSARAFFTEWTDPQFDWLERDQWIYARPRSRSFPVRRVIHELRCSVNLGDLNALDERT